MSLKQSFMEKAANALDFPSDIVAGLPKIEVRGCRSIYVENHKGLLLYESREIHINGGQVLIKLKGDGFTIRAMNAGELRIDGLLTDISFEY